MEEIDKKIKLKKIFFKKNRGMVCTTQLPWGVPRPSSLFEELKRKRLKLRVVKRTNKKAHYNIYTCACARVRPLGAKIEKTKKPYTLHQAVTFLIICTFSANLCKNPTKYLYFINFAKWSLQNDR